MDVGVIEAGLGGVRDATNVFSPDSLKLSIITPIGWEHVKALGNTLLLRLQTSCIPAERADATVAHSTWGS